MTVGPEPDSFAQTPSETELIRDAFQALSEGIAIYDDNYRLVTFNQRYTEMFPLIADLIKPGVTWSYLVRAGAERGQYVHALGNVEEWLNNRLKDGVPVGQTVEVELTSGLIYEVQFSATKTDGFVVANTDITERRQAEAIVREQENILSTVLETSPLAITMARLEDGIILYRSPGATAFYGQTTNANEHYFDPQDRADFIDALIEKGRVDDYRLSLKNAKGERCAVASWGRLVDFEGDTYAVTAIVDLSEKQEQEAMIRRVLEACPAPIQMTKAESGEVMFSSPETVSLFGELKSAKPYYADPETRVRYLKKMRRDGEVKDFRAEYVDGDGKTFWGSINARLIDYNGEEVIVSHSRDLTDELRLEAELAQQQEQLYQNEKMSAMGELLAGVAHELNNPLSVVVGHSLMLREDCEDPETLRQVEKISDAAERCAKIVKTFLTMARQQPARMQPIDINDVVQTAIDVARYGEKSENISMDYVLGADLPKVNADPDQITQVFINLVLNAEQAMRDSGVGRQIRVTTALDAKPGGVEIRVEDDGPGIPEKYLSRVFEPFFTTKDVGEGTGIGLALCHRIVQSHNGQITVSQGAEAGTVFRIVLPFVEKVAAQPENQTPSDTPPEAIRVLIVDDEEDVAELNAEILMRAGYEVDVFNHAGEAAESLAAKDYGLILSDLNMPDVDGRGFFDLIKRDFPHMVDKTGFVTGDTMGRSSQTFLGEAQRPCVEKPVSPRELRGFVADILANAEKVSK